MLFVNAYFQWRYWYLDPGADVAVQRMEINTPPGSPVQQEEDDDMDDAEMDAPAGETLGMFLCNAQMSILVRTIYLPLFL